MDQTSPSHASMEPCLFRHGKILAASRVGTSPGALQWSHVFSDMVRVQRKREYAIRSRKASMEPCLFRHGKGGLAEDGQRINALQWSHVFSDMVRRI